MEALSVKAGIFASLFGILGIIGLVLLLASVIWLVIRVANFDSVLPALLCVVLSVGLIAGGLVLSPTPDYRPEPLRMPWETLLDWVAGLRDRKAEDGSEDGAPASSEDGAPSQTEMERMDVVHTVSLEGGPPVLAEGAEPMALTVETPPEPAKPAPEQGRVLVDEVLDGWRVRLTLPREWKNSCVVEAGQSIQDGKSGLRFSQKASMDDYGGFLFSLDVIDNSVDSNDPNFHPSFEVVLEKEDTKLIATYPTDVQFNYEVREIFDEYSRMEADIPGILSTVEFERA